VSDSAQKTAALLTPVADFFSAENAGILFVIRENQHFLPGNDQRVPIIAQVFTDTTLVFRSTNLTSGTLADFSFQP